MKKTFCILLLVHTFCLLAQSQSCLPDGITFSTQAQIDQFPVNYPGCTTIEGAVTISGGDEITNLGALQVLTAIGGELLVFGNYTLPNLNGLDNLKTAGGVKISANAGLSSLAGLGGLSQVNQDLIISYNDALTDLTGLESLTMVGGQFSLYANLGLITLHGLDNLISVGPGGFDIELNEALTTLAGPSKLKRIVGDLSVNANNPLPSLNGLESLDSLGGSLQITSCYQMTSLAGISGLTSIGGFVNIQNNDMLEDLAGLENVTTIGSQLLLFQNPALRSLKGLHSLTSIGGDGILFNRNIQVADFDGLQNLQSVIGSIGISDNPGLKSLNGLGNLITIDGGFSIAYNDSLTSITGLENLRTVSGQLSIHSNHQLSDCAVRSICRRLYFNPSQTDINFNAPGCNTPAEVSGRCDSWPLAVAVLADADGDCTPDVATRLVADALVRLSGTMQTELTPSGTNGQAVFEARGFGAFAASLPQLPAGNWEVCPNTPSSVSLDTVFSDTARAALLLRPLRSCAELAVQLGLPAQFGDCTGATDLTVSTRNIGTLAAQGAQTAVVMPPAFDLLEAQPSLAGQSGDTLFFAPGDLPALAEFRVRLRVKLKCDMFQPGQAFCWEAFASLQNGCPVAPPLASEIKLSAVCAGDSVRFTLKNTGAAATQKQHVYEIFQNGQKVRTDSVSLAAQESIFVAVPADGSTWRMEAEKDGGGTRTAVALENCGGFTPNWLTAYWLEKGPVGYDFDCRPASPAPSGTVRKTAFPSGVGPAHLFAANHPVTYSIDFQNTGNDTATQVLLLDALPSGLNVNTLRPLAASHPFTWSIRGGNTLEVLFDAAMLPGSATNPDAARGFFSFVIDQEPDNPGGTTFQNTAYVSFDKGPAVPTNPVAHTIGEIATPGLPCGAGGVLLASQSEVDQFPANFPGCTDIEGLLTISGADITNLHGLSALRSVAALSIVNNPGLSELSGLNSLDSVAGIFQIKNNPALTGLFGLENLSRAGRLEIVQNYALPNLNGLNNLRRLSGDSLLNTGDALKIQDNIALTSLDGLAQLTYTAGNISIWENPVLVDVDGLNALDSIGGTLTFYQNQALPSLMSSGNLRSVGGSVYIESNPALANLQGLQGLKTIWKSIYLVGLGVTDFTGLEHLDTIRGDFYFQQNGLLQSLKGLDSLRYVGGALDLYGNNALKNFTGLNLLDFVGRLEVFNNNALINFQGLNKLRAIGDGGAYIASNPVLDNLNGLNGLRAVASSFNCYYSDKLTSLAGLDSLSEVGTGLLFDSDPLLTDCAVFAVCNQLLSQPESVIISHNAPGCNSPAEVEAQCKSIPVLVEVRTDNDDNCLAGPADLPAPDVQVLLSGDVQMTLRPSGAAGTVFFKYGEDGPLSLQLPQFPTANWAACADEITLVPIPGQPDTLRATFLLKPLTQCPELSTTLHLPANFRGCLVSSDLQIATRNTGTVRAEGVITAVVMPPVFELISADPPLSAQSGDTLYFDLNDLQAFETANVRLSVKTRCDTFLLGQTLCWEAFSTMDNPCPNTLPASSEIRLSAKCLGDTIVRFTLKNIGDAPTQSLHEYKIFRNQEGFSNGTFALASQQSMVVDVPADGATYRMEAAKLENGAATAVAFENCGGLTPGQITAFWLEKGPLEYDFDCRTVIGSFDPNQKTAVPAGVGPQHTVPANTPIQYTIEFQNTGNDTAMRVLLRDVLSPDLDINTFRPLGASHPYNWQIRDGNILEVVFSPIALPYAFLDEPASHGFFTFEINQQPDLADGAVVENKAAIVFDFNFPIITNTVVHRIGQLTVRVDEPQQYVRLWEVLGNPTRETATFRALEFIAGQKRFELYDEAGRLVRLATFADQAFEFRREMLPGGVYVFRIGDAQGRVFSGKIVVTE